MSRDTNTPSPPSDMFYDEDEESDSSIVCTQPLNTQLSSSTQNFTPSFSDTLLPLPDSLLSPDDLSLSLPIDSTPEFTLPLFTFPAETSIGMDEYSLFPFTPTMTPYASGNDANEYNDFSVLLLSESELSRGQTFEVDEYGHPAIDKPNYDAVPTAYGGGFPADHFSMPSYVQPQASSSALPMVTESDNDGGESH